MAEPGKFVKNNRFASITAELSLSFSLKYHSREKVKEFFSISFYGENNSLTFSLAAFG